MQQQATDGNSALHHAAANGFHLGVRQLLKAGVSLDTPNQLGQRPLHLAASAGHVHVVAQLLAAGADASVLDADGLTPLQRAAEAGHDGVVKLMLQQQPVPSAELQVAVCLCDIFNHTGVLAQLLLQLSKQDTRAAASILPQVSQNPIKLRLVMLRGWGADTGCADTAAEGLTQQERGKAEVQAGLQHMLIALHAGEQAQDED